MRVLVVGSGAREHAIAWKLVQSPSVTELLAAPGNAGTAGIARNVLVKATDVDGLLCLAREQRVDFTVVGPEAPLAAGIADRFQEAGLLVFGPTREAARIESSKVFAKQLMLDSGVPTAGARVFSDIGEAVRCVESAPLPVAIKADGLASGKGVVVAQTRQDAVEALRQQMERREFGDAGERVLVEECLSGREISAFAFVDGEYISPLVAACDYKRIGDGDTGPNTGGMGSYSPPPEWDHGLEDRVRREVMQPVAHALCQRGTPYQGVLYAGLMLTGEGPKVLEFNCRMGDPEAQVVLPRLKTDLADVMMRTAQGRLDGVSIEWDQRACVAVVVASGGYPGSYETGHPIEGLGDVDGDVHVFHAGTQSAVAEGGPAGCVETDGGRVLTVAALGGTLSEARERVYANVGRIRFKGAYYRRDIAQGR